jgi:hypothetical protein
MYCRGDTADRISLSRGTSTDPYREGIPVEHVRKLQRILIMTNCREGIPVEHVRKRQRILIMTNCWSSRVYK